MTERWGPWRFQGNFDSRAEAVAAAQRLRSNYPDSEFKVTARAGRGANATHTVMYRERPYRRGR